MLDFHPGRLAFIAQQIEELSHKIFGHTLKPIEIAELVDDLHDETLLRRAGFPDARPAGKLDSRERLLFRYLTDKQVFEQGQETLWVDTASEANAIETLQGWVREIVAKLGIVVEINPTSNLLIGNLADLRKHPLWRLRPPIPNPTVNNLIKVCVGSDDPITFATTLPQEYMLLHDSLVLAGVDVDIADSWIDHARKTGLSQRFTVGEWQVPDPMPAVDVLSDYEISPILYGKPLWK